MDFMTGGSSQNANLTATYSAGNTSVVFRAPTSVISALAAGTYYFDFGFVLAGADFERIDGGTIQFLPGVTLAGVTGSPAAPIGADDTAINQAPTFSLSATFTFPMTISEGGTGAITAAGARSALGAAGSGANSDITSITGLTTPLAISQGGTAGNTAAAARASLGAAGSGANSDITSITGLTTPLAVAQGGTGSNTLAGVRSAIGAAASGANSDITSLSGLSTPLSPSQGGTGLALGGFSRNGNTTKFQTVSGTFTAGHAASFDANSNLVDSGYNAAPIPTWSISGGLPSAMAGTSTTASMTISGWQAADQTDTVMLSNGSVSWAVANGNAINGYAGGTTLPINSTIHVYAVNGTSGNGVYATATAPGTFVPASAPVGYQSYCRRLFSFLTDGAGAPLPFTAEEAEGGSYLAYLTAPQTDASAVSPGTTSRTLYSLSVPTGLKVEWQGRAIYYASYSVLFTSPDEADIAPAAYNINPGNDNTWASGTVTWMNKRKLITNTSGQLGIRVATASANLFIYTTGWVDFRRA
jgi:hypothetical protein